MSWHDLKGSIRTAAGSSGTVTLSSGSRVLQVYAVASGAGGAVAIPDGSGSAVATIPLVANVPLHLEEHHASRVLQGTGAQLQIVFTSTASYFVEYVGPAGAS